MKRELASLIVSETDLVEDELARLLGPFVRFSDRGELIPSAAFDALPSESRVACVLLAIKALHILGLRASDSATPAEITALSGLPGGTVRPKLRALLRDRRVHRSPAGAYSVPVNLAHRAAELLSDPA